jgi:hypothetical protein
VIWITKSANPPELAISSGNCGQHNPNRYFLALRGRAPRQRPAIDKIVGKTAVGISACFALFGPKRATLSRIKVSPPIIAREKIHHEWGPTRALPSDARTWGVRWEPSAARTRCVLLRSRAALPCFCKQQFCVPPNWIRPDRWSRRWPAGGAVWACRQPAILRKLARKITWRCAQARRRKGAARALRRRPRALRIRSGVAISHHRR